jgi:hypothetical protein
MISAVIWQAVSSMNIGLEDAVWHTSLKLMLLMLRQKAFTESKHPGMQLSLIEAIDNGEV